jgi:hypothetical protein
MRRKIHEILPRQQGAQKLEMFLLEQEILQLLRIIFLISELGNERLLRNTTMPRCK